MMLKKTKIISGILTVALFLSCFVVSPQNVQAKTATDQIRKLINQMENYEYKLLSSGTKDVTLTKTEKAKAAALSIKRTEKNHIKVAEFGENDIYKIANKKLKTAGKNLFGTTVSAKNLPKKGNGDGIYDAYRKGSMPVVSVANIETESDYVVHSTDITRKSANTYQVKKDLYYGYWGSNQGQSNYEITYQVKKSSKSTYGYVITNMKITSI